MKLRRKTKSIAQNAFTRRCDSFEEQITGMRVEINQRKEECFVRYYEMEIRHGIAMIVLGKVDSSEQL